MTSRLNNRSARHAIRPEGKSPFHRLNSQRVGLGAVHGNPISTMNYQHAFHAGNFADVHKHLVLARILTHLRGKPAAFRVIDSHAGAGRYDLLGDRASRSGEWRGGIARLWAERQEPAAVRPAPAEEGKVAALLAPYLDAVAAFNPGGRLRVYPGSPLIAAALM